MATIGNIAKTIYEVPEIILKKYVIIGANIVIQDGCFEIMYSTLSTIKFIPPAAVNALEAVTIDKMIIPKDNFGSVIGISKTNIHINNPKYF